jgi:uncharacterized protein YecT (DUF1311 family)
MNNKKIITKLLITIFCLLPFNSAIASDAEYLKAVKTDSNFSKADAELTKTYKQVLKDYAKDKVFTTKLVKAQLAWLKFRDAYLESMFPAQDKSYNYGSVYPTCYALTMTTITEERIKQLKQWLSGTQEGDVCSGSIKINN